MGKVIKINAEIITRHQNLQAFGVSVPLEKPKPHVRKVQVSPIPEKFIDLAPVPTDGADAESVPIG